MYLVTFNIWVGNRDPRANLIELADDEQPDVIAVQEAKRWSGSIPGHERVDAGAVRGSDAASNVLLVRKATYRVVKPRIIRVNGPWWIGPKHGDRHEPRTFVGATLESRQDGQRWDVLNVHRTPGGPYPAIKVNAQSWAAEHKALASWVAFRRKRVPNRPIVLLGDWNNRTWDMRELGIRNLASDIGAQMRVKGIDGALLVGATGKARKLPRYYGSDAHQPVLITARPKG